MSEYEDEYEADMAALERMESDPEYEAKVMGETHGQEFRHKELEYDKRGGMHEFSVPEICCYRYMLRMAQLLRFIELTAPGEIIPNSKRRVAQMHRWLTPEVLILIAKHWPEYIRDYRKDGMAEIFEQGWAKRLGLDDGTMN